MPVARNLIRVTAPVAAGGGGGGGPTGPESYWGYWLAIGSTTKLVRAQYDLSGTLIGATTTVGDLATLFGSAWGVTVQFNLSSDFSRLRQAAFIRNGNGVVSDGSIAFLVSSTRPGALVHEDHIVVWDVEGAAAYHRLVRGATSPRYEETTKRLYWQEPEYPTASQYRVQAMRAQLDLTGASATGTTATQTMNAAAVYVSIGARDGLVGARRNAFAGSIVERDSGGSVVGFKRANLWATLGGGYTVEDFAASQSSGVSRGIPAQSVNDPLWLNGTLRQHTEDGNSDAEGNQWPATGTWAPEVDYVSVSVDGAGSEAALYDEFSTPNGGRIVRDSIVGPHGGAPATDLAIGPGPNISEVLQARPDFCAIRT